RRTSAAGGLLPVSPVHFMTLRCYIIHAYHHLHHEHGQNFLHDKTIQKSILEHVKTTTGPIIEIGPGAGALTKHLVHLERPLRAVEIDRRLAESLAQRVGKKVEVVHD